MKIRIILETNERMEENGVLEEIENLLDDNSVDFTWDQEENGQWVRGS